MNKKIKKHLPKFEKKAQMVNIFEALEDFLPFFLGCYIVYVIATGGFHYDCNDTGFWHRSH